MVLAARIAATVFKTPSAKPEALDDFATVSTYTEGDSFDLRPCEFLGVCVNIVADYCNPDGDLQTYVGRNRLTRTVELQWASGA
ncbi:unnamed protein product [Ectocarpus sp. 13 AM-2016]